MCDCVLFFLNHKPPLNNIESNLNPVISDNPAIEKIYEFLAIVRAKSK